MCYDEIHLDVTLHGHASRIMKILNRLRGLQTQPENAMEEPVAVSTAPTIDRDEIDFYDSFDNIGDGSLLLGDAAHDTVDGLRRRIPELHEDFPPNALNLKIQQDETS